MSDCKLLLSTCIHAEVDLSVMTEAVEYRSLVRFLNLKGYAPKGTSNAMKEVYGNNITIYDVVKH